MTQPIVRREIRGASGHSRRAARNGSTTRSSTAECPTRSPRIGHCSLPSHTRPWPPVLARRARAPASPFPSQRVASSIVWTPLQANTLPRSCRSSRGSPSSAPCSHERGGCCQIAILVLALALPLAVEAMHQLSVRAPQHSVPASMSGWQRLRCPSSTSQTMDGSRSLRTTAHPWRSRWPRDIAKRSRTIDCSHLGQPPLYESAKNIEQLLSMFCFDIRRQASTPGKARRPVSLRSFGASAWTRRDLWYQAIHVRTIDGYLWFAVIALIVGVLVRGEFACHRSGNSHRSRPARGPTPYARAYGAHVVADPAGSLAHAGDRAGCAGARADAMVAAGHDRWRRSHRHQPGTRHTRPPESVPGSCRGDWFALSGRPSRAA